MPLVLIVLAIALYLYGCTKAYADVSKRIHADMDPDGIVSGLPVGLATIFWPIYFVGLMIPKAISRAKPALQSKLGLIQRRIKILPRNCRAWYLKTYIKPKLTIRRRVSRFEHKPPPISSWREDSES
jgi:hypothetical protein